MALQNEELPFLGSDCPIWKLVAEVMKNTHVFESRQCTLGMGAADSLDP